MTQARLSDGPRRLAAFLGGTWHRQSGDFCDKQALCNVLWNAAVPSILAEYARPASYTAGRLTIYVDTPAWASRLRQQQQTLIARLKGEEFFRDLVELKVQVIPRALTVLSPAPNTTHPNRLSSAAARMVRQVAAGIVDPKLRAALMRLGNASETTSGIQRKNAPKPGS